MEEERIIKISIGKSTETVKIEYEGFEDEHALFAALYAVANRVKVEQMTSVAPAEHRFYVIPAEPLSGNPDKNNG